VVTVGATDSELESAFAPDQPPEALQEFAFVAVQLRIENPPVLMLAGFAEKVTVGGPIVTVTVTFFDVVPPVPVQVMV
jgi:hypothetical protein